MLSPGFSTAAQASKQYILHNISYRTLYLLLASWAGTGLSIDNPPFDHPNITSSTIYAPASRLTEGRTMRTYRFIVSLQQIALVAALVLSVFASPTALAQRGSVGYGLFDPGREFKPEYSKRDVDTIVRVLQVSSAERDAIDTLYEGYVDGLRKRANEISAILNEQIERAEVVGDARLIHDIEAQDWQKEAETKKGAFLDDLRGLLTPEQAGRWTLAEREIRRLKRIGSGRVPGESTDVIGILLDVDENAASIKEVAEMLELYAVELDSAIVTRDKLIEDQGNAFREKINTDPAGAQSLWKDGLRNRMAIRDINRKYARQITPLLPAEKSEQFTKRFFEASYASLFKPTRSEQWAREAAALASLSDDQRAAAKDAIATYETKRWRILQRGAELEDGLAAERMPRELEAKLNNKPELESFSGILDLPKDHSLRKWREERFALDFALRRDINAILTEQQRSEVTVTVGGFASFMDDSPAGL